MPELLAAREEELRAAIDMDEADDLFDIAMVEGIVRTVKWSECFGSDLSEPESDPTESDLTELESESDWDHLSTPSRHLETTSFSSSLPPPPPSRSSAPSPSPNLGTVPLSTGSQKTLQRRLRKNRPPPGSDNSNTHLPVDRISHPSQPAPKKSNRKPKKKVQPDLKPRQPPSHDAAAQGSATPSASSSRSATPAQPASSSSANKRPRLLKSSVRIEVEVDATDLPHSKQGYLGGGAPAPSAQPLPRKPTPSNSTQDTREKIINRLKGRNYQYVKATNS